MGNIIRHRKWSHRPSGIIAGYDPLAAPLVDLSMDRVIVAEDFNYASAVDFGAGDYLGEAPPYSYAAPKAAPKQTGQPVNDENEIVDATWPGKTITGRAFVNHYNGAFMDAPGLQITFAHDDYPDFTKGIYVTMQRRRLIADPIEHPFPLRGIRVKNMELFHVSNGRVIIGPLPVGGNPLIGGVFGVHAQAFTNDINDLNQFTPPYPGDYFVSRAWSFEAYGFRSHAPGPGGVSFLLDTAYFVNWPGWTVGQRFRPRIAGVYQSAADFLVTAVGSDQFGRGMVTAVRQTDTGTLTDYTGNSEITSPDNLVAPATYVAEFNASQGSGISVGDFLATSDVLGAFKVTSVLDSTHVRGHFTVRVGDLVPNGDYLDRQYARSSDGFGRGLIRMWSGSTLIIDHSAAGAAAGRCTWECAANLPIDKTASKYLIGDNQTFGPGMSADFPDEPIVPWDDQIANLRAFERSEP